MRKLLLAGIALSLVAAAAMAAGGLIDGNPPHTFTDSDCFSCHYTIPKPGEPLRFMDTFTNLCTRCHSMSETVSHQVDVSPPASIAIPMDMPLDENGRITCVTCHDIHKPYINPLTGERTYFLRREPPGRSFCLACHVSDEALAQIRLMSTGTDTLGDVVTAVSHRPAMDKSHGFARFQVLDPTTGLDPLSLACLDCHSEPGAPSRTTLGAGIWRHAGEGIGLSHPIGVDYNVSTMKYRDLVPVVQLDKRLRLFDGKMGCCTCHDPYAPGDGRGLVIGSRDSFQDLCFACHVK